MIIDFHTHILPPEIKKNRGKYIDRDPCFAIFYSDPKVKIATAEELINSMDENGIDISVILNYGWTTHELCIETTVQAGTYYVIISIDGWIDVPCGSVYWASVREAGITPVEDATWGVVKSLYR